MLGEWTPCVRSFCLCAASPPHHNLPSRYTDASKPKSQAAQGATPQRRPTHGGRSPPEPVQKLEFVVPLCNAVKHGVFKLYEKRCIKNSNIKTDIYTFRTAYYESNIHNNPLNVHYSKIKPIYCHFKCV